MTKLRLLPLVILTFASSALAAEPVHAPVAPPAPKVAPAPAAPKHVAVPMPAARPAAKLPTNIALLRAAGLAPGGDHAAPPTKNANALHALPPAHVAVFPPSKITSGDATKLRALVAGGAHPAAHGGPAAPVDKAIADNVHLLMSAGADAYDSVMVTPSHVALVRKSGVIDLVSHADAKAQIATGKPHENKRIQLGIGPKGFPLMGEEAPNGQIRLYRQLPKAAKGEVSATDEFTSFALTEADAYHPWGEAAQTVTITIPHELLGRIETGELGGTGWRGLGGIAIDVVQEVQIQTPVLKAHLAGNWKDAVKK